jgi:diguanylate cyclase (GGDEF)-like protein
MVSRGEASNSVIGGARGGAAGVRQALYDLRFELAVIGLLILTIAAISFAGLILRNRFVIDAAHASRFTTEWRGDEVLHGNSLVRADPHRPLTWSCELRAGYQYPYCSYEIVLDRHTGHGRDLSGFKTIKLTLDYQGPADSLRISLKNFDPRYSKASDRQTMKFNQIELPLRQGHQTIEAPLSDFKVADWWRQWMRVPYRLSRTQFDNVASLEIDTGNNARPGHHAFRVENITLQGSIVPVEQWYLGILAFWIILICLFLIYRILGLQQDLRRRRLLEQVAKGEAQLARETARRDHLTGLFNRRGITERYQQMLAEHADKPVAIMLIDLDHFKAVNDQFGHVLGDEVLSTFAALLRSNTRDSDLIARWGGEEFLLIARVSDAQAAVEVANKLRLLVAAASFPHGRLTASFGVYYCDHLPEKIRPVIGFADRALYAAKEAGRDRVMLYDSAGQDGASAKTG